MFVVKDYWGVVLATFEEREDAQAYCDKLNVHAAACHAVVCEE